LLKTGEVEANLVVLNESVKLEFVPDLIARKISGSEHEILGDSEKEFNLREFCVFREKLELAGQE
jgi:hypothetical protein